MIHKSHDWQEMCETNQNQRVNELEPYIAHPKGKGLAFLSSDRVIGSPNLHVQSFQNDATAKWE